MKKSIITVLLLGVISPVFSQTKRLKPTTTITLTPAQIMRLDSAIQGAAQRIDSKAETVWFLKSFDPVYKQITDQMVVDTVKKSKPAGGR